MGGQTAGSMANGIITGTQGVGALIMYVFTLIGVILAGNGIYSFFQAHHNNQQGQYGKAAAKTIVGVILAGGLMYMINSGSMTMGAGTNSNLQSIVTP